MLNEPGVERTCKIDVPPVRQRLALGTAKENGRNLERLTALIEAGQVTPPIDRSYPLAELPEATARLIAVEVRGKIAITS